MPSLAGIIITTRRGAWQCIRGCRAAEWPSDGKTTSRCNKDAIRPPWLLRHESIGRVSQEVQSSFSLVRIYVTGGIEKLKEGKTQKNASLVYKTPYAPFTRDSRHLCMREQSFFAASAYVGCVDAFYFCTEKCMKYLLLRIMNFRHEQMLILPESVSENVIFIHRVRSVKLHV